MHWCIYIVAFYNFMLPKIWNIKHIFLWNVCQYNLVTLLTWTYICAHLLMYIYKNFVGVWNMYSAILHSYKRNSIRVINHSTFLKISEFLILYSSKGKKNRHNIPKCWVISLAQELNFWLHFYPARRYFAVWADGCNILCIEPAALLSLLWSFLEEVFSPWF